MFMGAQPALCLVLLACQALVGTLAHRSGGRRLFGEHHAIDEITYRWGGISHLSDVVYIGQPAGSMFSETSTTVRCTSYWGVQSPRYMKVVVDFFHLGGAPVWTASTLDYCSYSTDRVYFDIGTGYNITWCGTFHAKEHIFPTDQMTIHYQRLTGSTNLGGGFGFRIYSVPIYHEENTVLQADQEPRLIYSPRFPKPYQSNIDYRVVLHAPRQTTIYVKALYMDLDDCQDTVAFEIHDRRVDFAGPYCGRELFTASFDTNEIVLHFHTEHNVWRSGYILGYWAEPSTDDDEYKMRPVFLVILILGTAALILFLVLAVLIMMRRKKQRQRARATRSSIMQRGVQRAVRGYDNPTVYTIAPSHGAEFVPPPPYPGFHQDDKAMGDQTDAEKEAPPPYEELNPHKVPQRRGEQATQHPSQ